MVDLGIDSFVSLVRRTLPPVEAVGSAVLQVPRMLDEIIVAGSIRNAHAAMNEAEHRRELRSILPDHHLPSSSSEVQPRRQGARES